MLKLINGKKLILRVKSGKKYVVILSQSSSPQDINYKGEYSTFQWRNLAKTILTKSSKIISPVNRTEAHYCEILIKMHNLNLIIRKHQTNSKYKITVKFMASQVV